MPVILHEEDYDKWLTAPLADVLALVTPYPSPSMVASSNTDALDPVVWVVAFGTSMCPAASLRSRSIRPGDPMPSSFNLEPETLAPVIDAAIERLGELSASQG